MERRRLGALVKTPAGGCEEDEEDEDADADDDAPLDFFPPPLLPPSRESVL